jgi:hypothetical protein
LRKACWSETVFIAELRLGGVDGDHSRRGGGVLEAIRSCDRYVS